MCHRLVRSGDSGIIQRRQTQRVGGQALQDGRVIGEGHDRLRIVNDLCQSGTGVARVKRQIGGTGFQDGQYGHYHLGMSLSADAHHAVGAE
ncbi:hypothetical protein AC626_22265 [Pseudoalteromonas rubra]|uniref:Uncharacterized protein n=1 Tax=Pseudoalteromonas rubra TaxID=43658 RepID=A0A0L0EMI7_9GAMM|nr:hypothetical protein AC626_22265 [Pseudoalteromonas rubra]